MTLNNLTEIRAHIDSTDDDCTNMPSWPQDAILASTSATVWAWDFRGDDDSISSSECVGYALVGYDGSNDGGRIVTARLTAARADSTRYVVVLCYHRIARPTPTMVPGSRA